MVLFRRGFRYANRNSATHCCATITVARLRRSMPDAEDFWRWRDARSRPVPSCVDDQTHEGWEIRVWQQKTAFCCRPPHCQSGTISVTIWDYGWRVPLRCLAPQIAFCRHARPDIHVRIAAGKSEFGHASLARAGQAHRIEHARRPAAGAAGPARSRRQPAGGQRTSWTASPRRPSAPRCSSRWIPTKQLVYIVYQELVNLMGPVDHSLHLRGDVSVLMLCGLQGSGKTTTCGKLGHISCNAARNRCSWPPTCNGPAGHPAIASPRRAAGLPVYADLSRQRSRSLVPGRRQEAKASGPTSSFSTRPAACTSTPS